MQSVLRDKEKRDSKLDEVLIEIDYLKKKLEEKERQIKEISQQNNYQNKINEYLDIENIISIKICF